MGDWITDLTANRLNKTYYKTFIDLCGNLIIRNGDLSLNNRLFIGGDISLNGRLYAANSIFIGISGGNFQLDVSGRSALRSDLSLNNRLFVGGDVSLNSNLYVKQNLIVNNDVSLNNRIFIGGDISLNGRLYVKNDVSMGGILYLKNNSFYVGGVPFSAGGSSIFTTDVSMHNRLFVGTDVSVNGELYVGNQVFIGISGTAFQLDVSGNTNLRGNCTAVSYSIASDHRIKDSVKELSNEYNVENIRPVEYINKKLNKKDLGVIAHELQEFYPYLVTGIKDGEELQTVNYNGLIALLINEVKNLKKKISDMNNNINYTEIPNNRLFVNENNSLNNDNNFIIINSNESNINLNFDKNNTKYLLNNVKDNFTINYNNIPIDSSTNITTSLLINGNYYGNSIVINGSTITNIYCCNDISLSSFNLPLGTRFVTQKIKLFDILDNTNDINNIIALTDIKGYV